MNNIKQYIEDLYTTPTNTIGMGGVNINGGADAIAMTHYKTHHKKEKKRKLHKMKTVKQFIHEAKGTNCENFEHGLGIALRQFGTIKTGFKPTKMSDIVDTIIEWYPIEKNEIEVNEEKPEIHFVIDHKAANIKFDVTIHLKLNADKYIIHNFTVMES